MNGTTHALAGSAKKKLLSLSFLACGTLALAGTAQANLISNGSFDTDLLGWTLDQGGGCPGSNPGTLPYSAWVANHAGHSGTVYINACGEAGGQGPNLLTTSAVTGLTIGTEYLLGWDFIRDTLGTQGPAADSFHVEILGVAGSPFKYDYSANNVWKTESLSFFATATSHSFRFTTEANSTDASYYLDNVTLNQVPEPSTLAILGLGLAGIGFSRRKKAA